MSFETLTLALTAISIGVVHTALGPDHYVPLVALAKARHWTLIRTLLFTAWCGVAHIAGSFLLGLFGLGIGMATMTVEGVESFRGNLAAISLTAVGLAYFVGGLYDGRKKASEKQALIEHDHHGGRMTIALMIIFLLGPCEALVPILIYPAATAASHFERVLAVGLVVAAFSVATVLTMLCCVAALYLGLPEKSLDGLQRYRHACAGFALLCCGVGVQLGA